MQALVVDGCPAVRWIIRRTLESRFKLAVAEAEDVGEALDQLHLRGPFSLIVTDLSMPRGSPGGALVRRLKMHEDTRSVPVLVISGDAAAHLRIMEILGDGADGFLAKPFSLEQLAENVHSLLARVPGYAHLR